MSLAVIWRPRARQEAAEIVAHIALDNQAAAQALLQRLNEAVEPIGEHPYMYRLGRAPGTRELVAHPNYIVVYRVLIDRIDIVSVVHARREYP